MSNKGFAPLVPDQPRGVSTKDVKALEAVTKALEALREDREVSVTLLYHPDEEVREQWNAAYWFLQCTESAMGRYLREKDEKANEPSQPVSWPTS